MPCQCFHCFGMLNYCFNCALSMFSLFWDLIVPRQCFHCFGMLNYCFDCALSVFSFFIVLGCQIIVLIVPCQCFHFLGMLNYCFNCALAVFPSFRDAKLLFWMCPACFFIILICYINVFIVPCQCFHCFGMQHHCFDCALPMFSLFWDAKLMFWLCPVNVFIVLGC